MSNDKEFFDYEKYVSESKSKRPRRSKKKPAAKKPRPAAKAAPKEEAAAQSEIAAPASDSALTSPAEKPAEAVPAAPKETAAPKKSNDDIINEILSDTDKKSAEKSIHRSKKPTDKPEGNPAAENSDIPDEKPEGDEDVKVYIPHRHENFIKQVSEAFEDALDEDVSELEEISHTSPTAAVTAKPRSIHRTAYFTVGLICFIMAIIGFIFTVNFFVGVFQRIADNTKQKNEFAAFIYPIVLVDPAAFDTTAALPSEVMITAGIWDIIMYEDTDKYAADFDNLSVPAIDVEMHISKLFGNGLRVEHMSIDSHGFYYNPGTNMYTVPSQPNYSSYSPYIENMTKVGESYTLRVGYLPPTPDWVRLQEDYVEQPVKYMDYVVSKSGDKLTLLMIKDVAEQPERVGL